MSELPSRKWSPQSTLVHPPVQLPLPPSHQSAERPTEPLRVSKGFAFFYHLVQLLNTQTHARAHTRAQTERASVSRQLLIRYVADRTVINSQQHKRGKGKLLQTSLSNRRATFYELMHSCFVFCFFTFNRTFLWQLYPSRNPNIFWGGWRVEWLSKLGTQLQDDTVAWVHCLVKKITQRPKLKTMQLCRELSGPL